MSEILKQAVSRSLDRLGFNLRRKPQNQFVWLRKQNIRTILDVGACVGTFAAEFHTLLPDAAICCFEPLRDYYEQLRANLGQIEKLRTFNYALGNQHGEAIIYRNRFAPSSSLLPMAALHKRAFPYTQDETPETIQIRRLDDVSEDLALTDSLLIKLDVQGFEEQVIEGGRCTIARAKVLIIEVSFQMLYKDQPLFADIYDLLRPLGFRFSGCLGSQTHDPADGSVLFTDAVFLKD